MLNNQMDDFSVKPGFPNMYGLVGGEANSVQPGKRMLSSMTPVIVEKDGKLFLVAGFTRRFNNTNNCISGNCKCD